MLLCLQYFISVHYRKMSMLDFADFTVFNNGCPELFLHRYFCSILTSTHLSWTNHARCVALRFLYFNSIMLWCITQPPLNLQSWKSNAEKGRKNNVYWSNCDRKSQFSGIRNKPLNSMWLPQNSLGPFSSVVFTFIEDKQQTRETRQIRKYYNLKIRTILFS